MIGQKPLLKVIDMMIDGNTFPRFSVIQGEDGSGKGLVVKYIAEKLKCNLVRMTNSVDSIRSVMQEAYSTAEPMIFYFADADDMSQSARNAMLKITEEPPNNAYFILTVVNDNSLTDTIKSRANVFYMLPYTSGELIEFCKTMDMSEAEIDCAREICDNPGEVIRLTENGTYKLYNFVEKVMDNIAEVTVSNALKVANNLAFVDTDVDKFDLALFWKACIMYYCRRLQSDIIDISTEELRTIARIVMSTKECINMITKTRGINKRNVFDIWILDVRNILGEEDGSC